MATPRIFLSSTCYDLNEVRDSLYSFIEGLGYIPVFSDKNDVFYHPDLHSHEACIKEIENCQIFILILGGRFGGNYIYDISRSIVNAEYLTAKNLNIPIFTFIKREVHENHRVFIRNKKDKPKYYNKVDYPAIEKQDTAEKIFDFIDEIRRSEKNNAYFTFENSKDIRNIILKQLAGMFYDFLWKRQKQEDDNKTQELLTNLNLLGQKTEEIIENIYKKIDIGAAETEIKKLDLIFEASKFWQLVSRTFNMNATKDEKRIKVLAKVKAGDTFVDYLISKGKFKVQKYLENGSNIKGLHRIDTTLYLPLESNNNDISEGHKNLKKNLDKYFRAYSSLDETERIKVLNSIV